MKYKLLEIINNDTSCNKSATRYLHKTHPTLWKEVVSATSFLPNNALAKQRIWHVINDTYYRPVCPISNEYVKWREKSYTKTATKDARYRQLSNTLKAVTTGEQHWRTKNPKLSQVANEKFTKGHKNNKHKPLNQRNRNQKQYALKAKETCLKKYGVDNPSKHLSIRKKISNRQIENGATPKHLRQARDLYYEQVRYYTEQSWKLQFDKINPTRLNRSEYDLDHIYSKQQGFRDCIPPYIIGHYTNLQMLPKKDNYSKGMRCDKTKSQLFEDAFAKS
jgi:hypothetical protein